VNAPPGWQDPAQLPKVIEPAPAAARAGVILRHLKLIEGAVIVQEKEGRYSVLPIAIEGWLKTAIAAAEQLAEELGVTPATEADADPGGEHGGPAD